MSAIPPVAAKSCTMSRAIRTRVAKAAIISAVPPLMVKTDANPDGMPREASIPTVSRPRSIARNSISMCRGPFYGFNRPGVKTIPGLVDNWWRQGMMGSVKAHTDCVKAFSETDFTEDLKKITVPVLVMHSKDDQVVPYRRSPARNPRRC